MPVNPNPLEKIIEQKVCDHAKQLGCLVYKFTSPARRSVPDRLFILPGGKGAFFVEFKRKGAVPTDAQQVEISKIRGQGFPVFVIDSVDSGRCLIADAMHDVDITPALEPRSGGNVNVVHQPICICKGFYQPVHCPVHGHRVGKKKASCAACDRGDHSLGHSDECIVSLMRDPMF